MKRDILILTAVVAAVAIAVAAVFLNVSFLPALASEQGTSIDSTLKLLLAIAAAIFVAVTGFILYSVLRFRVRPGDTTDGPPIQNHMLPVALFFFVPAAIVLWSATLGGVELVKIQKSHQEEMEIKVTGVRWAWLFEYPASGIRTSELVLPVGQPVVFQINSIDVIHSFWVPEFRPKIDALPGTETVLRITPTKVGEYKVQCAELCGLGHTKMLAKVKVMEPGEFQAWVESHRKLGDM